MMLFAIISLISVFSNSWAIGTARRGADCTGGVVGSVDSLRRLAVVNVPRCQSSTD